MARRMAKEGHPWLSSAAPCPWLAADLMRLAKCAWFSETRYKACWTPVNLSLAVLLRRLIGSTCFFPLSL